MVDLLLNLSRCVLAAVLITSGVAKLFDREGSADAVRDFGMPDRLARPIAVLLPPVEIGVGAALLVDRTAVVAAAAATGLLGVFSVAIAVNLAQGRRPDCHCFGKLHSAPVGAAALARNLLLAALGTAVAIAGPVPRLSGWLLDLEPGYQALLAGAVAVVLVMAAQTWLLLGLLRQHGRVLLRLDEAEAAVRRLAPGALAPDPAVPRQRNGVRATGLAPGSAAPSFHLADVRGGAVALSNLLATGLPLLLVFTDPGCGPCRELLPDVAEWQRSRSGSVDVVVVSAGEAVASQAVAAGLDLSRVLVDPGRTTAGAYRAHGTPSAVLVGTDGRVTAPLAAGADAIRALVATAGKPGHAPAPAVPASWPVGAEAPDVRLADLDGRPVGLRASMDGRAAVLLFWNPGCGFCQQILEPVRQWERDRGNGLDSPRLVLVSSGEPAALRGLGFDSTVLLDQSFATGRLFGASGTPSAVLIAADGRVGSPVQVGGPAVLALLDRAAAHAPAGMTHA